jgi:predicted nucleotidyltransferase
MNITTSLLKEKHQQIIEIAQTYGVSNVRVFGSVARASEYESRYSHRKRFTLVYP